MKQRINLQNIQAAHATQHQKNKQPNQKMSRRLKQTILQGRHSGSLVTKSCLTLCNPMDHSLQGFSVHGILQARILEGVAISFSKRSSWPRDWTRVSYIAGQFFTIWAREAPKDTLTLGCHSLLQVIFPTQGSNLGLLHCRQILYHLSHQGSRYT